MRLAHKYIAVDHGTHAPSQIDSTPEQFEATMQYAQVARTLKSQDCYLQHFGALGWVQELHSALTSLLLRDRRILGLGSGFGEHELLLALKGYDVIASDIVEAPLALTKMLFPRFEYRALDVFNPPLGEVWDDVLITGMDSYFEDSEVQSMFHHIATLLGPAGRAPKRLIFVLRYPDTYATLVVDKLLVVRACLLNAYYTLTRTKKCLVKKKHGYRRSRHDIVQLAERAGFREARVLYAGFGTELSRLRVLPKLDALLGGTITRLDRRLHLLTSCTVIELILDQPLKVPARNSTWNAKLAARAEQSQIASSSALRKGILRARGALVVGA